METAIRVKFQVSFESEVKASEPRVTELSHRTMKANRHRGIIGFTQGSAVFLKGLMRHRQLLLRCWGE